MLRAMNSHQHIGPAVERDSGIPAVPTARSRVGPILVLLTVPGFLLLDLGNGFLGEGKGIIGSSITPGDLGRGVLLVAGLTIMLLTRRRCFRNVNQWFLILVCLGLLGPLSTLVRHGDTSGLAYDMDELSKTLYGPALIVLFLAIFLRFRVRLWHVLSAITVWGTLAGSCLILFELLDLGSGTYGQYSTAHKGVFIAQNDLGLGMTIALLVATYQLLYQPRPARLGAFLTMLGGMFVLGTRVAMLGAVAVPLAVVFVVRPKSPRPRVWSRRVVLSGLLIFVVSTFAYEEARSIADQSYQMQKFAQLSEGEFTRVALLASALRYTSDRGAWANLFGEGADRYQSGVATELELPENRGLAEIDWLDLYGTHGLVFVIALYAFYIVCLLRCARARFGDAPRLPRLLALAIGLYLLHGTLAGHAMWSPLPTGVVAPIGAVGWLAYSRSGRYLWRDYPSQRAAGSSFAPAT
jgi:O-antigen ligase like membrane protein